MRRLRIEEIIEAFAVEEVANEIAEDNKLDARRLLSSCHGVIVANKDDSTVGLIHTQQPMSSPRSHQTPMPTPILEGYAMPQLEALSVRDLLNGPAVGRKPRTNAVSWLRNFLLGEPYPE
jgi:hypothetical protein